MTKIQRFVLGRVSAQHLRGGWYRAASSGERVTLVGHALRSRTTHAQHAELMLRIVCHNVAQLIQAIEKFDVEPRYWAQDLIAKLPEFGSTQPHKSALVRIGVKDPVKETPENEE